MTWPACGAEGLAGMPLMVEREAVIVADALCSQQKPGKRARLWLGNWP
jgi:hypothetical protein